MATKFTKKIAKEIAFNQFQWTVGCVIGTDDPDYGFYDEIDAFEQEFSEKLEEKKITITPSRIKVINEYYEKYVKKAKSVLERLCNKA
jgi:hypothetical protein